MFEPEVFWKQMYSIEESTCDIVGNFRRPGNCGPSRYAPGCDVDYLGTPYVIVILSESKGIFIVDARLS